MLIAFLAVADQVSYYLMKVFFAESPAISMAEILPDASTAALDLQSRLLIWNPSKLFFLLSGCWSKLAMRVITCSHIHFCGIEVLDQWVQGGAWLRQQQCSTHTLQWSHSLQHMQMWQSL
jgi:hypothetical protein